MRLVTAYNSQLELGFSGLFRAIAKFLMRGVLFKAQLIMLVRVISGDDVPPI